MNAIAKTALTIFMAGSAGIAISFAFDRLSPSPQTLNIVEAAAGGNVDSKNQIPLSQLPVRESRSGDFLSSYHAQSQHDWQAARNYLDRVLKDDPDNAELLKRSMVLAMGEGDITAAANRARAVIKFQGPGITEPLANLVIAVEQLSLSNIQEALDALSRMPQGDVTDFIRPILAGWCRAGQGKLEIGNMPQTTIHLYHAALMATYLHDEAKTRDLAGKLASAPNPGNIELERMGDLYAVLRDKDKALGFYAKIVSDIHNAELETKIKAVREQNPETASLLPPLQIKAPGQGAALALYDMAHILHNEQTDNSARLFAQMAIVLDPELIEARILLGDMLARNGRIDEAINFFNQVPPGHKSFLPARRYAADLLAEAGRRDEAKAALISLFSKYNDVESLIRIGDLYRSDEQYKDALEYYNKAAGKIGGVIPEDYWHLLYARGMAYEREGQWSKAEADLKAALAFRPDHPYLLNYLGYGWADQGINLEKSLELIERAVSLRPSDGYITDSLGWVLYMMGRYKDAVAPLERAVELLPYDPVINEHLGDAYWRVGRKIEATYQWQRALGYAEEEELKATLTKKIAEGLPPAPETAKSASPKAP